MVTNKLLVCVLFAAEVLTGWITETDGLEVSLSFLKEPEDIVAIRNQPLELPCSTLSSTEYGPVNVTWTHQGHLVSETRRHVLSNGSLYFEKVLQRRSGRNQSDKGEYRCYARNSVGVLVSRPSHVTVAALAHEFIESPENARVEEGEVARFRCQIISVPDALISWERNGESLPQDERYNILSGVLQIAGVKPDDAGNYRCLATNPVTNKQRFSSEAILEIPPASKQSRSPQFLTQPRSVNATTGQQIWLECAASGYPLPVLTWTFTASAVGNQSRPVSTTKVGVHNLLLSNITLNDTGIYTCLARSQDANRGVSQTITQENDVAVLVPPSLIRRPESQVFPTAKTVRFECLATGHPRPDIVWLKNGEPLKINGRIKRKGHELVLSNTVTADSGIYQCVAENSVGYVAAAARLSVNASENQPQPPQKLECRVVSSTKILLTWDRSQIIGLPIMAYTVHYLPTNGGEERQTVVANISHLVEKLQPHTNYTFYVRAYSERSASDQSPKVTCITSGEEGTTFPIIKFHLEAASSSSILVKWESPSASEVYVAYRIQWHRRNQVATSSDEVGSDVREYVITDLTPGKQYEIRVLGATSQGWLEQMERQAPWSNFEMPQYNSQNIPLAPVVHLIVINATSIEVTWSMPSENKYKASGFKIYYCKQSHSLKGPIIVLGNQSTYLLTNLLPQTWYEVRVVAMNADGDGEYGSNLICTLPESTTADASNATELTQVLQPPANFEAKPTSSKNIRLTWSPPSPSYNVSYYTIRYYPILCIPNPDNVTFSFLRSTSHRVDVVDLTPYTTYKFSIRSHDQSNRQGPYSQTVECTTEEDVPTAPTDVTWHSVNVSSVLVSWQEPQVTNGVIEAYHIFYTEDPTGNSDDWKIQTVHGNKLNFQLNGLSANMLYHLYVKATTKAGSGKESSVITVRVAQTEEFGSYNPPSDQIAQDQHLGVIVGVTIGLFCLIICSLILVVRTRRLAMAARHMPVSQCNGRHHVAMSGTPPINGNRYCPDKRTSANTECQEMEIFMPMLTNLPANEIPSYLDTKGGYPNGHANGVIRAEDLPGTHTEKSGIHITENPQYHTRRKSGKTHSLRLSTTDEDDVQRQSGTCCDSRTSSETAAPAAPRLLDLRDSFSTSAASEQPI